jgi:hypothetical protein
VVVSWLGRGRGPCAWRLRAPLVRPFIANGFTGSAAASRMRAGRLTSSGWWGARHEGDDAIGQCRSRIPLARLYPIVLRGSTHGRRSLYAEQQHPAVRGDGLMHARPWSAQGDGSW